MELATHVVVHKASAWKDQSLDDFWDVYHEGVWTSADWTYREEISMEELADMDMLDKSGHKVPFRKSVKPHGVLMDLTRINELFKEDLDDVYLEGQPGPSSSEYSVYPQAGMWTAGHFQVHGLMTRLYSRVDTGDYQ
ncbi:hypothetical protein L208DRAFT_1383279 [Tricholoma matsutake]|nr:hypothetical protein L208DRAFT_1383279 [Tricholoma matsutake 945]